MTDLLVLDLVSKKLVTDQVVLTVGYDIENLKDVKKAKLYKGEVTVDYYGRKVPKHAHGTQNISRQTSSGYLIEQAVMELFDRVVDRNLLVKRINISVNRLIPETDVKSETCGEQLDLFTDYTALEEQRKKENDELEKERNRQEAILNIRKRYGKNAILRGLNFEEGATTKERNEQIGGHKA